MSIDDTLAQALSTLLLAGAGALGAYVKSYVDQKRRRDKDLAAAAEKLRALQARIGGTSWEVSTMDDVFTSIRKLNAILDSDAPKAREVPATMDFYDRALAYLLKNEGGFVDNPKDPGGPTKWGITQGTLADWRGIPVSGDDVKGLSSEEMSKIYLEKYWEPSACDKMSQYSIACAVFDASVLFGLRGAAVCAQLAAGVTVDGHIGEHTLAALNALTPDFFLEAFRHHLRLRIEEIISARPSSAAFRSGWQARIDRYPIIT